MGNGLSKAGHSWNLGHKTQVTRGLVGGASRAEDVTCFWGVKGPSWKKHCLTRENPQLLGLGLWVCFEYVTWGQPLEVLDPNLPAHCCRDKH